jgi:predicted type IV restriction endonuclease
MGLDPNSLLPTIDTLSTKINAIRVRAPSINEENTKNVLIGPLFHAMGWDLYDLDEVRLEYRHQPHDNPVDYAFFIAKAPRLFIEAKALGVTPNDPKWISQVLAYASSAGVEWCVLTNGDEYRIYNAHAPVAAEGKFFRSVKISDGATKDYTAETLSLLSKERLDKGDITALWKSYFVDSKVKPALEQALQTPDEGLVSVLVKKIVGLSKAELRASLKRAKIQVDFPAASPQTPPIIVPKPSTGLSSLIASGYISAPMEIEATFKKNRLTATIQPDGSIRFNGNDYQSLSTAAGIARSLISGPPPAGRSLWETNGWDFWRYRDPKTGELCKLISLRKSDSVKS